ncbi:MAG TPA: M20/M25/M40 family metallo-hydrolase [Planctomycetota bacterium]|nr:M20/M25/M40 family metallo-hydrolase [Planctomycetota bacterium]
MGRTLPPLVVLLLAPLAAAGDTPVALPAPAAAFASITEAELSADLKLLADPAMEGRDTPSVGLSRAADYIEKRYRDAGFTGAGKDGSFRIPFTMKLRVADPELCALELKDGKRFTYGTDFVPMPYSSGSGSGEVVFVGFGIESTQEHYDDVRGDLHRRVALIVDGEPRHRKLFEGPDVSPAADMYIKLGTLEEQGAAGVLIVQRPPPGEASAPPLSYRSTWASWPQAPALTDPRHPTIPVLEITPAVAAELVGQDVLALAAKADTSGKEPKRIETGQVVSLSAASLSDQQVPVDNIVGLLRGADPKLADEYVVVGAHYDHIGVDWRGRIGPGADDNGSGTVALLEVAQALAAAKPRRSILVCSFAAEEDGELGSRAICATPPVPLASMVAMLNMDQIGRGPTDLVAVMGLMENPTLDSLLDRGLKLEPTKIKTVLRRKGQDLFERSDHYSFHLVGVPALFFFENLPLDENKDYHTWRDTVDLVDMDKCARTARLVFNCAWLLANEDGRPPSPKKPSH